MKIHIFLRGRGSSDFFRVDCTAICSFAVHATDAFAPLSRADFVRSYPKYLRYLFTLTIEYQILDRYFNRCKSIFSRSLMFYSFFQRTISSWWILLQDLNIQFPVKTKENKKIAFSHTVDCNKYEQKRIKNSKIIIARVFRARFHNELYWSFVSMQIRSRCPANFIKICNRVLLLNPQNRYRFLKTIVIFSNCNIRTRVFS